MTGIYITIIAILLIGLALFFFNRWMERRLVAIYRDCTSPDALVRARCYVRESRLEEPGVAQVLNGTLSVFTVTGKAIQVPLPQLKLIRIRKHGFLLGRHPWWGKTCFWLEIPRSPGLVLAFRDPSPWMDVFKATAEK